MIRFSFFALLFLLSVTLCPPSHAQVDDLDPAVPPTTETPAQTSSEAPQPVENDFKLEAGARAGDVLLGMTSKALLALKGKPTELLRRSPGVEEIAWGEDETEVRVILASDVVVQITVRDPRYKDALGNSLSSPMQTIFARYRAKGYDAPKDTLFQVNSDDGVHELNVYDDGTAGITFIGDVSGEFTPSSPTSIPPTSIVIHRAGKDFIPPRNAIPASLAQKDVPEKEVDEVPPAPAPRPRLTHAVGNGWPLTEKVNESGARGWSTSPVILPSKVGFGFYAFTSPPPGEGGLWHPLVWMYVIAVQERPVWQNVSSLTLSFAGRRLELEASKQTTQNPDNVTTALTIRVPFRDFLEMARAGKFFLSVDHSAFAVERAQTVGMRALARLCGDTSVSLDTGTDRGATPSRASAPVSGRRPTRNTSEFFPQTSRRRLSRREVSNLSDGDFAPRHQRNVCALRLEFQRQGLTSPF
jgi:hypothetical protein